MTSPVDTHRCYDPGDEQETERITPTEQTSNKTTQCTECNDFISWA